MRYLFLLALLCCGCAAVPTARASAEPSLGPGQLLSPVATFDDGTRVGMTLSQVGSELCGCALLVRGSTRLAMTAVGLIQDGQLSVRLTPDSRTTGVRTLVVTGPLAGSGTWVDRVTGASGRLTLSGGEALSQRGDGLTVPETLQVTVTSTSPPISVKCQITQQIVSGLYAGQWTSDPAIGLPAATTGTFFLKTLEGHALVQLTQGAGVLSFPLPAPGQSTPLDPDSDIVFDLGEYDRLTGTVTLVQ